MAKYVNFYLDKGSDFSVEVELVGVNDKPLDLTNCTFACNASHTMDEDITMDISCTVYSSKYGIIHLFLPFVDTEKLKAGKWRYDIEMTLDERRRIRVCQGYIIVKEEVTGRYFY